MQSPSFLSHLLGLFLVTVNLVGVVRWLWKTRRSPGPASVGALLQRTAAMVYATASALAFVLALLLFQALELSGDARAQWLAGARWREVHPGMSATDVRALLGPPRQPPQMSDLYAGEEIWEYQLHPFGALDEGYLAFGREVGGDARLLSKLPSDDVVADTRSAWLPQGYTRTRLLRETGMVAGLMALCGLVGLAIAAVLPFGPRGRWRSWTLYTPAAAALLGVVYEVNAPEGWRFDLFLVVPLYIVIALGWLVRWLSLRGAPRRAA